LQNGESVEEPHLMAGNMTSIRLGEIEEDDVRTGA